jgi:hypothetical protein
VRTHASLAIRPLLSLVPAKALRMKRGKALSIWCSRLATVIPERTIFYTYLGAGSSTVGTSLHSAQFERGLSRQMSTAQEFTNCIKSDHEPCSSSEAKNYGKNDNGVIGTVNHDSVQKTVPQLSTLRREAGYLNAGPVRPFMSHWKGQNHCQITLSCLSQPLPRGVLLSRPLSCIVEGNIYFKQ